MRPRAAKENNMYYQTRHVEAQLHKQEAMMRAMMPNISASDPEPLTIYENDRTPNTVKTLTYSVSDVMRRAMMDTLDRFGKETV
jgi:hypothetical protein